MDPISFQQAVNDYSTAIFTLIGAVTAVVSCLLVNTGRVVELWGGLVSKKI